MLASKVQEVRRSSLNFFFDGCFFNDHDRNVVPNGINTKTYFAFQTGAISFRFDPGFAKRTTQNFQKIRINVHRIFSWIGLGLRTKRHSRDGLSDCQSGFLFSHQQFHTKNDRETLELKEAVSGIDRSGVGQYTSHFLLMSASECEGFECTLLESLTLN